MTELFCHSNQEQPYYYYFDNLVFFAFLSLRQICGLGGAILSGYQFYQENFYQSLSKVVRA